MSIIPEFEWQNKNKKLIYPDSEETWQNKFKKPLWQRELNQCVKKFPSGYVYKPINKFYEFFRPAIVFDQGMEIAGSFNLKVTVSLKQNGKLTVFVRAMTPVSFFPQTTIIWQVIAKVTYYGDVILQDIFKNNPDIPEVLPDDKFTKIGYVNFQLPPVLFFDGKKVLVVEARYWIDTGHGLLFPMPFDITRKIPLETQRKKNSVE